MSSTTTTEAAPFEPLHGECICGNVKYDIFAPPPGKPGLCHCNNCKRQTGSMFSANIRVLRSVCPYRSRSPAVLIRLGVRCRR
ncbi:hypothetical protein CALVIDRAFT_534777 [Calocera viscosa TUFC12733]|uniref:CENP-V/GFA domain-containing protein n=1 Tax=Calocera viscosa (strain TUFC12733) TaxID=1330018 RepID=A0A167PYB4_CALVF|nr:hypothetical protein CALVIDRAFT_534777 [Calocera viscosa TUFC12733]